jgi:hypothetical protein
MRPLSHESHGHHPCSVHLLKTVRLFTYFPQIAKGIEEIRAARKPFRLRREFASHGPAMVYATEIRGIGHGFPVSEHGRRLWRGSEPGSALDIGSAAPRHVRDPTRVGFNISKVRAGLFRWFEDGRHSESAKGLEDLLNGKDEYIERSEA